MGRNYWNPKSIILLFACFFMLIFPVGAKENLSPYFVKITDATKAVKEGEQDQARKLIDEMTKDFEKVENSNSEAGRKVQEKLALTGDITEEQLTQISLALLTFEKEQNPVDLDAEKEKLVSRLEPRFQALDKAIASQDLEAVREAYKKMNSTWTINEAVVRDHSTAHYGQVETAISFLRSSIETEPTNFDTIQASFDDLKKAISNFVEGTEVATTSSNLTLKDGIDLLKKALTQFQAGQDSEAAATMKEFITIWPTIEGSVSTTNPSLYTKVESESPVIMVKGKDSEYQEKLSGLIAELSQIDTSASYNAFDAMLILLREGVEALLIVMALVTTLKAAKMRKGLKWVYSGAFAGIVASLLIAYILQIAFPAVTSGTNREIIEGAVGIFAVIMMILIGIWLHSKSSVKKWNTFMESQMQTVTKTGSFLSMFALSFLAVFREGAETILFYVGILPRISSFDFVLGISLALLVLVVIAFVMNKASQVFLPHKVFFILTWMIYALAFKMTGVSIHALQLTNMIPNHLIAGIPTIDILGIYPSWESLAGQTLFILVVILVTIRQGEK
ncbi:FTR1 family iron permease [Streptococcus sp. HMSC071D03]|uniref:FTR1 family iron permease n=1 Tax=Streptococcus sp. HMSC071D03 TaxID=1739341 RepID=UPI0008D3CC0B|nr:FTR1 family protein [Streptococcus sp. HMSC071D03]OFK00782.1 FTR1 family iron permease [Streptococcus sp. HMSC071D03]